jgi:hypothetical protein
MYLTIGEKAAGRARTAGGKEARYDPEISNKIGF